MAQMIKPMRLPSSDKGNEFRNEKDESSGKLSSQNSAVRSSSQHEDKEMKRKFADLNYFDLAAHMKSSIPIRKHIHRLKSYPGTMLGSEIEKWLLANHYANNPAEVVYLGSGLIGFGHIYDVLNEDEGEFQSNHNAIYRFCADDRKELKVEDVDLNQVEVLLTSSVKRQDVIIENVMYTDAFSGADAVSLLVVRGIIHERKDAVRVGQNLLKNGMISNVTSNQDESLGDFQDSADQLYCLHGKKKKRLSGRIQLGSKGSSVINLVKSESGSKLPNINGESMPLNTTDSQRLKPVTKHPSADTGLLGTRSLAKPPSSSRIPMVGDPMPSTQKQASTPTSAKVTAIHDLADDDRGNASLVSLNSLPDVSPCRSSEAGGKAESQPGGRMRGMSNHTASSDASTRSTTPHDRPKSQVVSRKASEEPKSFVKVQRRSSASSTEMPRKEIVDVAPSDHISDVLTQTQMLRDRYGLRQTANAKK
mmetsp:Transcript_22626/g.39040  ORF Transcript_22626/g.39040 Transcript_22626/m.39040 type:complete len:477 (+) Transcript_22626:91-1521(+)